MDGEPRGRRRPYKETSWYLTCVARVWLRCTFCERPFVQPPCMLCPYVRTVVWWWDTAKVGGSVMVFVRLCAGDCVLSPYVPSRVSAV